MLRLVSVTKADVEVLFELATFAPDNSIRKDVLAQATWLLKQFDPNQPDQTIRMVLVANMHEAVTALVSFPLVPSDTQQLGITFARLLELTAGQNALLRKLKDFEYSDPKFMSYWDKPDTTFLN
jgi:hypothetical protein